MKQHHLIIGVVLLLLSVSPHAATAVICAPTGGANGSSSGSASTSSGGCPECVSWVDLTTYLVPTYSGWETAKQTTHQSLPCCPPDSFTRKLLYGPTQFELIKFNDPHSSETYTWDSNFIYLTAENKINGTTSSRVFPAGGGGLGFWWMPRYRKNVKIVSSEPLPTVPRKKCNCIGNCIIETLERIIRPHQNKG